MIRIVLVIFLSLGVHWLSGQAIDEGQRCRCDVLLSVPQIDTPDTGDVPGPDPDNPSPPAYLVKGDLFEFEKFVDGKCIRTVEVFIKNKDGSFKNDLISNDIPTILHRYQRRKTICLEGDFIASETINFFQGRTLKLFPGSSIDYTGDGSGPLIDLIGGANSIIGNNSTLTTGVPMSQGVIRILSDGTRDNGYNQIKDLSISSTANANPNNDPPDHNASIDRGLYLTNPTESIFNQTETNHNYWAKMSNLTIEGFRAGIHARGWTNVATIRNILFKDISGYGIWLSGCIDNSIAEVQFVDCTGATAIRLDNYVDDSYHNGSHIGDQDIALSDPNERISFSVEDQLTTVFDIASASGTPLDGLMSQLGSNPFNPDPNPQNQPLVIPSELFSSDPLGFVFLRESCKWNTEFDDDGNIENFGFFSNMTDGFKVDEQAQIDNFDDDTKDVFMVWDITIDPMLSVVDDPISFYKETFEHEKSRINNDPNDPEIITLEAPTCIENNDVLSQFFLPPSLNSFTRIRVTDSDGNLTVNNFVEMAQREDDGNLCIENTVRSSSNTPVDCTPCLRLKNGNDLNAFGEKNIIVFCNIPSQYSDLNDPNNSKVVRNLSVESRRQDGSTYIEECSLEGISGRPVLSLYSEN